MMLIANRTSWKRVIVRSLVGGAACGMTIAVVLIAFYFYQVRSKGWNSRALRTVSVKAEPIDQLNEQFNPICSGIIFTVDVENTTNADLPIPQHVMIMGKTRGSNAIHGTFLKLNRSYFIPAKAVETITLESDQLCAANFDPQSCFDSYFKNDQEIVLFENLNRNEVRIPIPTHVTLPANRFEPSTSAH
jgi:hypothetical protein